MTDRGEPEELDQDPVPRAGGHAADPDDDATRLTTPEGVDAGGRGEGQIAPDRGPGAAGFAARAERLERFNEPAGDTQGLRREPAEEDDG
jgi:hypothetical protein